MSLFHPKAGGRIGLAPVVGAARLGVGCPERYVQSMTERRPYPSDLSDARWELIEPVLTNWRAERRSRALDIGRPPDERLAQITPDGVCHFSRGGWSTSSGTPHSSGLLVRRRPLPYGRKVIASLLSAIGWCDGLFRSLCGHRVCLPMLRGISQR